MKATKL